MANLLSDERRKSGSIKDKSRRGSRESLDMAYEGEEVSYVWLSRMCGKKKIPKIS